MFRVLAVIVDFRTQEQASRLACQIASGQSKGIEIRVVHVDNGNAPPVELSEKERELGVELLRVSRNDGYAGGLIAACSRFSTNVDAYWFLNSDLEVAPDCLQQLVDLMMQNSRVGAVGPRVFWGHGERIWGARGVVNPWLGITAMTDWPQGGVLPRWSYIPGSSLLIRTEAYNSVGGLSDRYRMYYEETELCVKLQKAGWDLAVHSGATAYHQVSSLEKGVPAPHFAFYFARNNLFFWKNNFGIPWIIQLPRALFVVFKELILPLRRASGPRAFFSGLTYVLAGLIDGFAFLHCRWTYFERKLFLKQT